MFFLLVFVNVFFSIFSFCEGASPCENLAFTFFETQEYSFTISEDFAVLTVNISETLAEGSDLYRVTPTATLQTAPFIDGDEDVNSALDYMSYEYAPDGYLSVSLVHSILGLVDYGQENRVTDLDVTFYFQFLIDGLSETDLDVTFYFQFLIDGLSEVCKLQISHRLLDENTNAPVFEKSSFSVELREDFPLNFPIPELQMKIYDNDVNAPNNVFEINTTCPFGPKGTSTFQSHNGESETVEFVLKSPLDYEAFNPDHCMVYAQDKGNGSLQGSTTVYYNVTSIPDEEPVLTNEFYNGLLMSAMVGSLVTIRPDVINASDPDYPDNSVITYAITGSDIDGAEDYFQMDSSTGTVTVKNEIDKNLLSAKVVTLTFTACDIDSQCAIGYLAITLPTVIPSGSANLKFEKSVYSVEVVDPERGQELLQVHAQSTIEELNQVKYSIGDSSKDSLYFSVEEDTGVIKLRRTPQPDLYTLTTVASYGIVKAVAKVNIKISYSEDQIIFVKEPYVKLNVSQSDYPSPIYTIDTEGAKTFCILYIQPDHFKDSFSVNKATGDLFVEDVLPIDADGRTYGNVVRIKIGAYKSERKVCRRTNSTDDIIYKNEVEIEIQILDNDDYAPYFVDQQFNSENNMTFYYPTQVNLQKAVKKVATMQVIDNDYIRDYRLFSQDIKNTYSYDVDTSTGDIFLVGTEVIEDSFTMYVNGSSGSNTSNILIYPLEIEYIYTIRLENLNINKIEEKIANLSIEAGVNIYLLYFTAGGKAESQNLWTIDAHVYATDSEGSLLPLDSFVRVVDKTEISAVDTFSDKEYFEVVKSGETDSSSYDAYRTSTIVLATILGCFIIAILCYYCYTRSRKRGKHGKKKTNNKQQKVEPSFASIFGENPKDQQRS